MSIPFIGAFESTFQPAHDKDVLESTEHDIRWQEDLDLLAACHVRRLRYPLRWHRIEREPGRFDWDEADRVLGYMRDNGFEPIVDLLHHTSYPLWLGTETAFLNPVFESAFVRFCEAVAERYDWLPGYTVINEPFTTFLLCGEMGVWPPHLHGLQGFVRLARNLLPASTRAARLLKELLPDAQHVHVEAAERHSWSTPLGEEYAAFANDRRFAITDLFLGRGVDRDRPFARALVKAGGADLLDVEPGPVDVLGLDYYAHNQWQWAGISQGTFFNPDPAPLSDLVLEYSERYDMPLILGETNIRGLPTDRATWLKYTLEQCELAAARGADLQGYCWFPFVDSADWGSLLRECVGAVDPVGVYWLDENMDRQPSEMSAAYALAASGVPAERLPAYRLHEPVASWLAGWLPQMSHWQWRHAREANEARNTDVA